MKAQLLLAAALLAAPALAADPPTKPAPSPGEIVAAAPANEWIAIAADDLLVMDLTPGAWERPRRVIIQLIPAPFSGPWVANIRTLAKAHWWDGLAIVRAQDNYVVQWGDPDGEDVARARALPVGLPVTTKDCYTLSQIPSQCNSSGLDELEAWSASAEDNDDANTWHSRDAYASWTYHLRGWPMAMQQDGDTYEWWTWPVHCYGTVGVGRDLSPDAGTGAELYAVIGHAPRHLDRNIAVVGRVIEGIEHLSTLPRGTEALGFYKTPEERTPIVSVRLGTEVAGLPAYQYLSTDSEAFARYADARANRRDPFFIVPAGGADVCNIPVPVRRVPAPGQ